MIDLALISRMASTGIVPFAPALSPARVEQLFNTWSVDALHKAVILQGLDYLWLLIFTATRFVSSGWLIWILNKPNIQSAT